MSHVQLTYDGTQHCTAVQDPNAKTVAIDCPKSGNGEEFYPDNLVGAGLAGCMLLSMGAVAQRDHIDISGTKVDVNVSMADKPDRHIGEIDVTVSMPKAFSPAERQKLEKGAAACPIKHSFRPDTKIVTRFEYPA